MVEWLESSLVHPEGHPDEGFSILTFAEVDALLSACCADAERGIPPSLAGGVAVAAVLARHGYDTLHYVNAREDVGSLSWVCLDPARARILEVAPVPYPTPGGHGTDPLGHLNGRGF